MTKLTLISEHASLATRMHLDPAPGNPAFRVICATDLWGPTDHALEKALWLAGATHAKLMLLHVVEGETPLRLTGKRAGHARNALEWRVRRWPQFKPRPAISVRVGKPHQIISRVAREWRADLVVLGASRPRMMKRFAATTAERVATQANCAVLVVKRSSSAAYSHATIVAGSCCQAAALEHATDKLQILKRGTTPAKLDWAAAGSKSLAANPGDALGDSLRRAADQPVPATPETQEPSDLIIVAADRWPALTGLFGGNAVSRLSKNTASDVLVWSHRKMLAALRLFGPDHECLDRWASQSV